MNVRKTLIACVLAVAAMPACAQRSENAVIRYGDLHHPTLGREGMVAAQNRLSAEVGAAVLADGGNAVDAAIATGFSLAVTLPRAGNLGGGGFMLVHDAQEGEEFSIDYREMAPLKATRDMFLDADGNVDNDLARFSHKSAGVPGTVAGFWLAHQRMGRLPWKRLVQPAIDQARNGIVVSFDLASMLERRKERLCRNAAACGYFYKEGGVPYEPGELLVQADLADTLEAIAENGPDGFYRGRVAEIIAAEMQRGGGLIDAESLAAYEPALRDVVRGTYRGYDIVAMSPPSSGGVHVIQMLNILERFPVAEFGRAARIVCICWPRSCAWLTRTARNTLAIRISGRCRSIG